MTYAPGVTEAPAPRGDPELVQRLIDTLPAAAFVIDAGGTVRFVSEPAAALVERDRSELVGESVLSFVDEGTAWAYAAAVAMAGDFGHVVLGPLRVSFVTAGGQSRAADLWAINQLDDPVVRGIVCLLTPETAAMGLSEAITALVGDAPFATVAARVVRAMQGHPTVARAALLAAGPSGMRLVAGTDDDLPDMSGEGPWEQAVRTGMRQLAADLGEVPAAVSEAARAAGCATVWVEPVSSGELPARGALVLWRTSTGRPTPNELHAMHQAAAVLALAWERHDRVA